MKAGFIEGNNTCLARKNESSIKNLRNLTANSNGTSFESCYFIYGYAYFFLAYDYFCLLALRLWLFLSILSMAMMVSMISGNDCTFEKLDAVRGQQEQLARLHFELDTQQDPSR